MDPAVKPAAAATRTGKVGVLATTGTFRSERYAHLLHEFARGVEVLGCSCPGLVELVETGRCGTPEGLALIRSFVEPMVRQGVDTLVLGCTHFPLAREQIQAVAGPGVQLIDPAPAVARQAERVLQERGLLAAADAAAGVARFGRSAEGVRLFSTGTGTILGGLAGHVLGSGQMPVEPLRWVDGDEALAGG
jgi:glutamate racemase